MSEFSIDLYSVASQVGLHAALSQLRRFIKRKTIRRDCADARPGMADQAKSMEESNAPKHSGESDDGLSEGDLDEVLEDLTPVAAKYRCIGLRLGVKCNDIGKIEKQYKDPDECLYEILHFRLKQIPALTQCDIYNALMSQSVNEKRLARKLRKKYGLRESLPSEFLEKSDVVMERSKKKKSSKVMGSEQIPSQREKESECK